MIRDGKDASHTMSGKRQLAGLGLAASLLASPALAATPGESRSALNVGATVVESCRVSTAQVAANPARLSCSAGTNLPEMTTAATPVDRVRPGSGPSGRFRFITLSY